MPTPSTTDAALLDAWLEWGEAELTAALWAAAGLDPCGQILWEVVGSVKVCTMIGNIEDYTPKLVRAH